MADAAAEREAEFHDVGIIEVELVSTTTEETRITSDASLRPCG